MQHSDGVLYDINRQICNHIDILMAWLLLTLQSLALFLQLMKIFTIIMSFYLLWLSCIPCADRQESIGNGEQRISANADTKQQQNNNDICTPFCNCSCCAASAFHQTLPHYSILKMVFQSMKYPVYTPSFRTNISFSIWQPPKFA